MTVPSCVTEAATSVHSRHLDRKTELHLCDEVEVLAASFPFVVGSNVDRVGPRTSCRLANGLLMRQTVDTLSKQHGV